MGRLLAACILAASAFASFSAQAQAPAPSITVPNPAPSAAPTPVSRPLLIGSGEVTGFYYPAAGALCRVLNKEAGGAPACAVLPSSGSAANLKALRVGAVDMALVQAQAAQAAQAGIGPFKEAGAFSELRAVMSLHGESVLVLARQGAGIENISDLKGKRVNLGRPGSFQRAMAEAVLEAVGLSEGDLAPAVELELSEQSPELCEGNVDAAFYAGVHPMPEAEMAVNECDAQPVAIKAKTLDAYVKAHNWITRSSIRKGAYDGLKDDVASLQVRALLVATTRTDADMVQRWLKAFHGNFSALTHLHPVLRGLGKGETAKDGISIPLHDGADKFYGETGLK
nr:TAXI family TRAP transporter solute-binding subunit [Magnetospirillum gryphiswaldense]